MFCCCRCHNVRFFLLLSSLKLSFAFFCCYYCCCCVMSTELKQKLCTQRFDHTKKKISSYIPHSKHVEANPCKFQSNYLHLLNKTKKNSDMVKVFPLVKQINRLLFEALLFSCSKSYLLVKNRKNFFHPIYKTELQL